MRMLPHRILCVFLNENMQESGHYLGRFLSYGNERIDLQIYLNSTCLVALLAFLVINFPDKDRKESLSEKEEAVLVKNRLWINIGFSLIPIFIYILQVLY